MPPSNEKNKDYSSLTVTNKKNGENGRDYSSISRLGSDKKTIDGETKMQVSANGNGNLVTQNSNNEIYLGAEVKPKIIVKKELEAIQNEVLTPKSEINNDVPDFALTAEERHERKKRKLLAETEKLLNKDRWLTKNGHNLTYIGLFLFTLTVYFRPYEWIPAFSGFTSMALVCALLTLAIYVPTQFSTEGSLTILTTEIKCILFLGGWSLLLMPISKDIGLAWATFNDTFSKIIIIFIVLVNTLRTKKRMIGLMWLSIGIGVMLSYQAIGLYQQGIFKTEGYRVNVDFGGMFGNPNDLSIHLVMFTPIAIVLGIIAKNYFAKLLYFVFAGMMVFANMISQSRGGFLGLLVVFAVLVWKLSRKNRVPVILASLAIGLIVIAVAPGNYGLRILSIFDPSLDAAGSNDQRRELLIQSLIVTARNPWGIGLGNFPVVGQRNLSTHNAYTQVSSELGVLSLIVYIILMVSPLRKLMAIEKQMFVKEDSSWMYYMSIGLQASIIGYMVSSFFGPVAYNWFIYFPIGYAVCLRRIYRMSREADESNIEKKTSGSESLKPQGVLT